MTTEQHPITPPEELVQEWCRNWTYAHGEFGVYLATQAARWGADQELEACVEWLVAHGWFGSSNSGALYGLRAARRPKPPSLAEQALTQLDSLHADLKAHGFGTNTDTIRRALERLQELKQENND